MTQWTIPAIKQRFEAEARPNAREGMARFGINAATAYGVAVPVLRALAKEIGKDHAFAQTLWQTNIHEARILASMVAVPAEVTEEGMEEWATGFDSWDVCDQVCMNLFSRSPLGWNKAYEWESRDEEFVRRAAFAIQASLAVHEKQEPDERFLPFFPLMESASTDPRNYVKKAVNWALRQTGKRSAFLREHALHTCERLLDLQNKPALWIARDAIRELESEAVRTRLGIE